MARDDKSGRTRKAKKAGGIGETLRFLLMLFLFAVVIRSFIIAPFSIPSGSMFPRMMIGDYLFVAKWPYGYSRYSIPFGLANFDGRILAATPKRGDVVVFRHPIDAKDMVKRLIGLPGDQIEVRGGAVLLNGKQVPRTRIADYAMPITANSPCRRVTASSGSDPTSGICTYPRFRETLPDGRSYEVLDQGRSAADDTEIYVVPEGHYFVMGDNRDDSADSRFSHDQLGVEFLPADHVIGKALIVFFSTDGSAAWVKPWTWFSAARWERVGGTF